MKTRILGITAIGLVLLLASPAFAKWKVVKNGAFVGGGYRVLDNSTGRQMDTKFKTKKGAKAAAKVLNEADDAARNN